MLSEKEIQTLVAQIAGEDTIPVVEHIISHGENVSEFLIAENLELPINTVRNMLYRLQENNLITFTRKKDKKKGWYIYYWTFNESQAKATILRMKENRLNNLKKRLERESSSHFYMCSSKCLRVKFDNALDHNFMCPECAKVLKEQDNSKILRQIKKELTALEKDMEQYIQESPVDVESAVEEIKA